MSFYISLSCSQYNIVYLSLFILDFLTVSSNGWVCWSENLYIEIKSERYNKIKKNIFFTLLLYCVCLFFCFRDGMHCLCLDTFKLTWSTSHIGLSGYQVFTTQLSWPKEFNSIITIFFIKQSNAYSQINL